MSIKPYSMSAAALVLLAATAVVAIAPARAEPVAPTRADNAMADMSAARRHHNMQRSTVRDAYGAYVGDEAGSGVPMPQPYGYGVGDNSRNQTW